jgi:hypothetical protein
MGYRKDKENVRKVSDLATRLKDFNLGIYLRFVIEAHLNSKEEEGNAYHPSVLPPVFKNFQFPRLSSPLFELEASQTSCVLLLLLLFYLFYFFICTSFFFIIVFVSKRNKPEPAQMTLTANTSYELIPFKSSITIKSGNSTLTNSEKRSNLIHECVIMLYFMYFFFFIMFYVFL